VGGQIVLVVSVLADCVKSCMCSACLSFLFRSLVFLLKVFLYRLSSCICMLCVMSTHGMDPE
jgi:hypothetical protein